MFLILFFNKTHLKTKLLKFTFIIRLMYVRMFLDMYNFGIILTLSVRSLEKGNSKIILLLNK